MTGSRSRRRRDQLQRAILKERFTEALDHYQALERIEPREPRWPHRKGDLLKRLGRAGEAVPAYERAVDLYAQQGFLARAAAMAKVIMGIDPDRIDVLERVTPDAARELRRSWRANKARRLREEAIPLIADDAAEDTLRFTHPPEAERLNLDISAAELSDRTLAAEGQRQRPTAKHLAQLPSMPLFSELPDQLFTRLVRESRLIDLEPGETLIERGTTADALYALIEGSVQLIRPQDEDAIVLSEGEVVGVSCLLDRVNYEGAVTARTRVRALRISKLLLDILVEEHAPLGDVLLEVLGRRLVSTLVRTSPMFSSFDVGARSELASLFDIRRAPIGTTILEAGKRIDGLYIPMIGSLEVLKANGQSAGTLKLGSALGQDSMLTGLPSPVTVRAVSDVLVLRLSARRFKELLAERPNMVAHLEELARRRSAPAFSVIPARRQKSSA